MIKIQYDLLRFEFISESLFKSYLRLVELNMIFPNF